LTMLFTRTRAATPNILVPPYTYLANGLRQSKTVFGQPTLSYTYDLGNRLTRIDQAAGAANDNVPQSIVFAYDAAGRRIRTTYMNGMTRDNSYDDAGQLTAITYTNADGSVLGDLAYAYDNGGRRIATSGSLARTALPDALPDAAVDAANRLTAAGTQTLTYDANGNLSGDGSRQFVWNARDQLVQIKDSTGAVVAAFTYDALGRRQTKTVDGVATGYVYDGANIVQELAGAASANNVPATVKASYVGAGLDEVFAQLSGTGESAAILTYLTDALGSTIRLVDAAGAKVVEYTYDPYGNTTADAVVSNPFQYTGRENDGTGLYYYRARYYSPKLARFIFSDPIGLDGGINTYAYVEGNPLMYTDPLGLFGWADMPTLPQEAVDFSAGLGDALLLGTGRYLRDLADVDGGVDQCSNAYDFGSTAALAAGGGRMTYAGLAKASSLLAASGAGASAFRVGLRTFFRGGIGRNWRPPNLAGKTDAQLRKSAGKTNSGMNAYGAGVAAAGGMGAVQCGCQK
jgi:RHS repeat-associated protein